MITVVTLMTPMTPICEAAKQAGAHDKEITIITTKTKRTLMTHIYDWMRKINYLVAHGMPHNPYH